MEKRRKNALRVALLEKEPFLGGNSAKASSGINRAAPGDEDAFTSDTRKSAGDLARNARETIITTDSVATNAVGSLVRSVRNFGEIQYDFDKFIPFGKKRKIGEFSLTFLQTI